MRSISALCEPYRRRDFSRQSYGPEEHEAARVLCGGGALGAEVNIFVREGDIPRILAVIDLRDLEVLLGRVSVKQARLKWANRWIA